MARILVVDDEAEGVERMVAALRAGGHLVSVERTAADALAAVRRVPPDLVVLEALLDGDVGGIALAHTLAREAPRLPLIMLTRLDELLGRQERRSQDRDGGWIPVDRFLEKPVMPEVLAQEVDHVLHERAGQLVPAR